MVGACLQTAEHTGTALTSGQAIWRERDLSYTICSNKVRLVATSMSDFDAFSPDYFLDRIDLTKGCLEFAKIDRDSFRRAAFLDERLRLGDAPRFTVRLSDADAARRNYLANNSERRINYIFHTSFCRSTLIARCLDMPGRYIALREPRVLMQLANYKRTQSGHEASESNFKELLELALFYLTFSGNDGERVTIKSTNSANNLIADILRCGSTAKTLLLYSDLQTFLLAIIRGGEVRRAFIRKVFRLIQHDSLRLQGRRDSDIFSLTDLQIAVLAWHLHIDQFLDILSRHSVAGIKTLDQSRFAESPVAVLGQLAAHFGYVLEQPAVQAIVSGPSFTRHAKDQSLNYEARQHAVEERELESRHGADIQALTAWGNQLRPEGAPALPLPYAL